MKRLLLYVHFNKFGELSPHVIYQLEKIRPNFSKVIFISNSQLSSEDTDCLISNHYIDNFIQRENIGFDFAAWRDGMAFVGFDYLNTYDSVTIMNDTCFGPLWDLSSSYKRFETDGKVDFWGMTNHREVKKILNEHIQSYFISFKKRIIESDIFQNFWQNINDYTDVQRVIDEYETQMTRIFLEAGFTYDTMLNANKEDRKLYPNENFSQIYPSKILLERVPFLKIKAIAENPVDMKHIVTPYILDQVEQTSDYPVDLIVSHMSKINRPDFDYLLNRKYLRDIECDLKSVNHKIAVHLHVFYVDLLQEFLNSFETFKFDYDLFITTDSKEKELEIRSIIGENKIIADISVFSNIGRDILPMLKLKEKLSIYSYIGHFHTKKSTLAVDYLIGQSWRRELVNMLVDSSNSIVSNFVHQEDLGVVIADIPTAFRYHNMVYSWQEKIVADSMNDLWQKMGMSKSINFCDINTFVMSYGTFVWFKYDALEKLFDLELDDSDIPEEPLPQNSILHVIERLLIYVAWDKNYDFRISKNLISIPAFVDNRELNGRDSVGAPNPIFIDFNQMGGIKGAVKFIFIGPAKAVKYIIKRLYEKNKT